MRITTIFLAAAAMAAPPTFGRDWLDGSVMAAAIRVFAEMPDDYFTVRPDAANKEAANTALLILDVREPREFNAERIAGAKNIPVRQLAKSVDALPDNKAAPIVVYCRSGHRGAIALMTLRMAGYTNVRSIAGGLEAWKTAGLPVVK